MRRTDAEFKEELERRKSAYFIRRKRKIRNTAGILCSVVLILACGAALPMLQSGKSADMLNGSGYFAHDMESASRENIEDAPPAEVPFEGVYGNAVSTGMDVLSVKIRKVGEENWEILHDETQMEEIGQIIQLYLTTEPGKETPEGDGYELWLVTPDEDLHYTLIGDALQCAGDDGVYFDAECGERLRALLEQMLS